MNGQRLENKIYRNAGRAKDNLTSWAEDGASQLNKEYKKMTNSARETVGKAAATMQKDVQHGLGEYNTKAAGLANKIPGGFGKKAAKYPWVAISLALVVGLLLGSLFSGGNHG